VLSLGDEEARALGVEAGRKAFLAGRIPRKDYATASSPTDGVVGSRATTS
jgi:thiazole synthase